MTRKHKISILIITRDQPHKLRRALAYYSDFTGPIFVADGSDTRYAGNVNENVLYFNIPKVSLWERVCSVLNYINTEFSCLVAGDDIVSPGFLIKASEILDNDPSLSAIIGDNYAFLEESPNKWARCNINARSILKHDPLGRFVDFFGNSFPLFYAPTRTNIMSGVFCNMCSLPSESLYLAEMLQMAGYVAAGKILHINQFHQAREMKSDFWDDRISATDTLKANVCLTVLLDDIVDNWLGLEKQHAFVEYVWKPYNESGAEYNGDIITKLKLIARRKLGRVAISKLKRTVPFISAKSPFVSLGEVCAVEHAEDLGAVEKFLLEGIF